MITANFHSPLGSMLLRATAIGLTHCQFAAAPPAQLERSARGESVAAAFDESAASCGESAADCNAGAAARHLSAARNALAAYFGGARDPWSRLALAPEGTSFQRRVWNALRDIPWGSAISYGELAQRIAAPRSARAVGAANARNPLAVIIPCHRVIAATGLGGYAAGPTRKQHLLAHERTQLC